MTNACYCDSLGCNGCVGVEAEPKLTECERCGELACDDEMANWERMPEGYLCPSCVLSEEFLDTL